MKYPMKLLLAFSILVISGCAKKIEDVTTEDVVSQNEEYVATEDIVIQDEEYLVNDSSDWYGTTEDSSGEDEESIDYEYLDEPSENYVATNNSYGSSYSDYGSDDNSSYYSSYSNQEESTSAYRSNSYSSATSKPSYGGLSNCVGGDSLYTCYDSQSGNSYQVSKLGNTTYVNGSNANTGSNWSQTTTTLGNMATTHGYDKDGNSWNQTTNYYGNNSYSYNGTNSDGESFGGMCNSGVCSKY